MVTVHLLFVITFPSQLTLYLIPVFSSVKPVKGGGGRGIGREMGVVSFVSVCVWVGFFCLFVCLLLFLGVFFGRGGKRGG